MACRQNEGRKLLLCLGLFVVASSFCHCMELTRTRTSNSPVVWALRSRESSTLVEGKAGGTGDMSHGRLLIGRNSGQGTKLKGIKSVKNFREVDANYQSDMGWEQPELFKGQVGDPARPDGAAVERLLKMEPKVECTKDSMKLKVHDAETTPTSLFFVDRGSRLSPLPLSKLPPSCGYTIKSTQRDLVLVAPYDGCFVILEEDRYVLPLHWCGLPVRMSCPTMRQSSPNPPMVTCHVEGMVVKTEWSVAVKMKINLTGQWEPLMTVSARCGFSVVVHPEGVVISVRFAPCVEMKDGMFTIELAGDGEFKVSCPALSPLHPKATQSPAQPAVPQGSVYPQYHEVSNQINQLPQETQEPYFPFHPNPFRPNPVKPDTPPRPTPAAQPPPPHVTKVPDSQQDQQTPAKQNSIPKGSVPQPLNPFPFYPWPAQPEDLPTEPAILPQATQPPRAEVEQPFYTYPLYAMPPNPDTHPALTVEKPELQPIPITLPPVIQIAKGQIQQLFNPQPFYPQPPKHETLPAQNPATKGPLEKLQEPFYQTQLYPPSVPSLKPVKPPINQFGGQKHQPFYPFPFYPQPPRPTASEAPQHQVHQPLYPLDPVPSKPEIPEKPSPDEQPFHPFPFYPHPFYPPNQTPKGQVQQPETPSPGKREEPQGQVRQPFYPYPFYPPFYPEGPSQEPVPPTQQPPNQTPKGQVQQPETPSPGKRPSPGSQEQQTFYPQPPKPPASEAPQGQVRQPFYPYPFYPYPFYPEGPSQKPVPPTQQPPNQTPKGQVQQPETPSPGKRPSPGSQEQQSFYPQPPKPSASEAPQGEVHQPFYPYPFDPERPSQKPVPPTQQPPNQTPQGQVPFKQYFPQQPQNPQPVTLLAVPTHKPQQVIPANNQKPQQPANPQPSHFGVVPQHPDTTYVPPMHCPQICSSGFYNCCPQVTFHHHHYHHIVPAGIEAEGVPQMYPGLPFLPALGYSIIGFGLESAPHPHKPSETTKTSVSTTVTSDPENVFAEYKSQIASQKPYFKPPDGNPAALPANDPNKPAHPEQPTHPFSVPYNSQYPKLPYQPQDEEPPNFSQSLSPAHSNTPSKPQVAISDPMLQYYKLYNLQPPKQPYSQLYSGNMKNPSEPKPPMKSNFVSHIAQYLQQPRTSKQLNEQMAKELQPLGKTSSESEHPAYPQDQSELFDPQLIPYYMLQDSQAPDMSPTSEHNSSPQPPVSDSQPDPPMHSYSQTSGYVLLQHGPPGRKPYSNPAHLKPEFPESFKDDWKPITPLGSGYWIPSHDPGHLKDRALQLNEQLD